jgi:hypothetical protein
VLAHPEIIFILIHFSLRYKNTEIEQFFGEVEARTGHLKNVVLFLSEEQYGVY